MKPVSRPTRSLDSKTTVRPKARAFQAGGTAEGASSARAVSGIRPKEEKLAGYLMARTAIHQKVEGQDLKNLWIGHESVQKVCDFMPLGRANVIEDIEKAKNAHIPLRKVASDKLTRGLLEDKARSKRGDTTESDYYRASAASALYSKTGTCGSYSVLTAPLHATRLARMGNESMIVSQAKHTLIDHGWSEMHIKGMGKDGQPVLHDKDVIMDGWSKERLAVFREDSEFAHRTDRIKHLEVLDHRTGPEAEREVARFRSRIEGRMRLRNSYWNKFETLVDAKVEISEKYFWNATSIFHAEFRQHAGKAVHPMAPSPGTGSSIKDAGHEAEQAKRATLPEIQAVGVARSLGANIRGAVAEAPKIIASAKEMFPDPR
ncbi:MAG TPA: hypothetical protein VK465_18105 [Fibrobacteria bacterium]|nr:hypothetical protein [Fibrobacteria bacterium]